ncbi:hypothetical protein F511_43385 [Dorcoceras hygrometricum]|uniref:Uncharacterized protein n=1 Tax=Dorcoceras hygrometricum TaxID=472368 RepID=A0A2Z7BDF8_9LAMI|nr:hypothetical protein F511_43385 [Dorcoceras hygrometricum]
MFDVFFPVSAFDFEDEIAKDHATVAESTLVKVTVAPAGGIGISRYGDISVTREDLLALVRIEVAAGRHRSRDVSIAAGSNCVVLVAADQQARFCKSVEKRRRLIK